MKIKSEDNDMERFFVKWEQNEAKIEVVLHDSHKGDHEEDIFELILTAGKNNGNTESRFYLSQDDLLSIIFCASNALLSYSTGGNLGDLKSYR